MFGLGFILLTLFKLAQSFLNIHPILSFADCFFLFHTRAERPLQELTHGAPRGDVQSFPLDSGPIVSPVELYRHPPTECAARQTKYLMCFSSRSAFSQEDGAVGHSEMSTRIYFTLPERKQRERAHTRRNDSLIGIMYSPGF